MTKNLAQTLFKISLISSIFIAPVSQATKGVEAAFGQSYFHMGIFSLYTLDGRDIKSEVPKKGFVSTKVIFKSDENKSTSLLDVTGEIGRFITSDEKFSFSIVSRALVGKTETRSNNSSKKLNVRDLIMGIRLNATTWLSEVYKLNSSIAYFRSPKILSFGDFEYLQGVHAEINTPIMASSEVYLSYEKISGKTTKTASTKTVNLLNSLAVGVRFAF